MIDDSKIREAIVRIKRDSIPPSNTRIVFIELAEALLSGELVEPMSDTNIRIVCHKWLNEAIETNSIIDGLIDELSGNVAKQFIPASESEIEKIREEAYKLGVKEGSRYKMSDTNGEE